MPGDRPQEWTVATLHEYMVAMLAEADKRYEQRFLAQEEAIKIRLEAQKEAITKAEEAQKEAINKAEEANNKRFESTNEWRRTVSDMLAAIQGTGKGLNQGWGYLVAAVALVGSIITILLALRK